MQRILLSIITQNNSSSGNHHDAPRFKSTVVLVIVLLILTSSLSLTQSSSTTTTTSSNGEIQVDVIHNFTLEMRDNDFSIFHRKIDKILQLAEGYLYFKAPIHWSNDYIRSLLRQHLCIPYFNSDTIDEEECVNIVETFYQSFQQYAEQYERQALHEKFQVPGIDIGFTKRIQLRNSRLNQLKEKTNGHSSANNKESNSNGNEEIVGVADDVEEAIAIDRPEKEEEQQDKNVIVEGLSKQFTTSLNESNLQNVLPNTYQGGDLAVLVSGYWYSTQTRSFNHTKQYPNENVEYTEKNPYLQWMENCLAINMPYILFGDIEMLSHYAFKRQGLPSMLIPYQRHEFYLRDNEVLPSHVFTDPKVPSSEVSRVWLEKMHLMYLASQIETNAEYYVWIDAALSSYRNVKPPSWEWSWDVLSSLPKNRISYCRVFNTQSFAAGVIVIPRSLIRASHYLFYSKYRQCMEHNYSWLCGWEEYLWTSLVEEYPDLFHSMSYGYGDIGFLWGSGAGL